MVPMKAVFPLILALGLALLAPAPLAAGSAAFEEDTDGDGQPDRVVLENEFLRLVFTPDGFGRQFLYRPTGTDVLGGVSRMLFHWDVFEVPNSLKPRNPGAVAAGWQGTTRNMARPVRVVKDTPEEAAIEMTLRMPAMVSRPEYDHVSLTLRLTLREGVNAVFGRNTAVNEAGEPQPITFRQGIRKYSPGVIWGTYVPDIEGPRVAIDLEPGPFSFPALSGTLPSAWIGGVNEQGFGLAVSTEWRVTDMVEAWCSKSPRASLQWAYRTQVLEPGEPWSTEFTVAPFEGFEEVSGFRDGVAGQLEVGELDWELRSRPENKRGFPPLELAAGRAVPVEVRVAAVTGRDLTIEFGSRRLPEEEASIQERAEVTVDAGSTAARSFTWTPASEGTHVVVARVLQDGEPVLLMEKPFVVGATDQAYFAAMPDQRPVGEATIGAEVAEPPLPEAATRLDLEAVEIPRKPFGRNYVHGPLRLLFVCQPKHDLVSARELYQRMDLVLDHLVVPEGNRGQSRKLVRRLSEGSPDVLFLSGYPWKKTRALSLAAGIVVQGRVRQGMGLVMLAPLSLLDDPKSPLSQFLAPARPLAEVPFLEEIPGEPVPVRLFTLGEGRIAVIDGFGTWNYDAAIFSQAVGLPPTFHHWDYGLSEWIKAIHWAADHEAGVRFADFRLEEEALAFRLESSDGAEPVPLLLRWELFDEYAEPAGQGVTSAVLSGPEGRVRLALPSPLPSGQHLVDLRLEDSEGRTVGWASHLFEAGPGLRADLDLAVQDRFLERGEPVAGEVVLTQPRPAVHAVDVILEIEDVFGRLTRRESRRVSFSEREFRLPFSFDLWPDARHDHHTITAEVRRHGRLLAKVRERFSLRWRPHRYLDDFAVGMWTTPGRDLLGYVTRRTSRGLGMDYFYHANPYHPHARRFAGPTAFPMGGPRRRADNATLTISPSLSDPEVIADRRRAFRERVEGDARGDVRFWMLEDERSFRGEYDYSEPTLAAFREWLRERFGSLEALNRSWETAFETWDRVRPLTQAQFREQERDPGNLGVWLDFRLFMGRVWADWTRYALEVVKEVVPDGEVGLAGIFRPGIWSGVDFWQAAKHARVGGRYNGLQEEWYRSFAPGSAVGQWGGYRPRRPTASNMLHPWRQLFHEGHFVWYYKYYANPGAAYQGVFNGDGTLHGMYEALQAEHRAIRGGIGRLLLGSEWLDDGIRFPYSQSTILANEFLGLPRTVYAMKTAVESMGMQHRFLSYEQIAAGEPLSKERGVRLLFLPAITCLSREETAAIREFVARGGVLVADRLAAMRDEHGRLWPRSPLDEVFGIDRSDAGEAVTGPVVFRGKAPEGLRGLEIEAGVPEPGLRLAGAEAWGSGPGGAPVAAVHRHGKGRAIYLNLDVAGYSGLRGGGAVNPELITESRGEDGLVRALDDILRSVLAEAGINRPRVEVAPKAGAGSLGESFYWANGGHLYFGFRPMVRTSVDAEVRWEREGHVYDVRTGRYHGFTKRIDLTVQPGRALVLSQLPYRVTGLEVSTGRPEGTAWRPGESVEVTVRVSPSEEIRNARPAKHVIHVDLTGPAGEDVEAHGGNFDAPGGKLELRLPLALNALAGAWTLRARDVASGVTAVRRFEVVPAE